MLVVRLQTAAAQEKDIFKFPMAQQIVHPVSGFTMKDGPPVQMAMLFGGMPQETLFIKIMAALLLHLPAPPLPQ